MPLTDNRNFFSPIQAEFSLARLPNVGFFCQQVNVPGIVLPPVRSGNPFVDIKHGGDHIDFEELRVTFKVDEDMTNYLEVYEWITRMGFPESWQQYRKLAESAWEGEGLTSDGEVVFLNSKSRPNKRVKFVSLFPIRLSDVAVDTRMVDVQYLTATASFAYTLYNIEAVT